MALQLALTCLLAAGCQKSATIEQYIPAAADARTALEAALTAWKRGEPPNRLVESSLPVAVQFSDNRHTAGQRLEKFEILGEVPGGTARSFSVKLVCVEPTEELRIRYYVVGIDPLWVWRQEDYDMTLHWEHPMEPAAEVAEPDAEVPSTP